MANILTENQERLLEAVGGTPFVSENFYLSIERGRAEFGIVIDSIVDIAVNKLFTIYQRVRARDFIDLYSIMQKEKFFINDLILKAKIKFDWHIDSLQLGTQFMKAQEAKDYPRMIQEISPQKWQDFFLQEAKKLKADIIA